MKCLYCGKSIMLGKVKLADGYIHKSCFRKLGFINGYDDTMDNTPFWVIKDGYDAYLKHVEEKYWEKNDESEELSSEEIEAAKKRIKDEIIGSISIKVANYGQERDLVCTEEERQIFGMVHAAFMNNEGVDADDVRLVRVSDNYVSIRFLGEDIMRYKFTNRAKWLNFPMREASSMHHEIDVPEDVQDYAEIIQSSAADILKMHDE